MTGRTILIAVVLSIAVVFGLAGWRYFNGENRQPTIAKPAPAPAVAPAVASPVATEASTALNHLEGTQQVLVDDLQLLQGRVAAQEVEIKRLKQELEELSQRYQALSSFASTAKEAKPTPVAEPAKNDKKRSGKRSRRR